MSVPIPDFFDFFGMNPPIPKTKQTPPSNNIVTIVTIVHTRIEVLGGRFHKFDGFDVCFDIPQDSDANNIEFLRRQRDVLKRNGYTLKIRIV